MHADSRPMVKANTTRALALLAGLGLVTAVAALPAHAATVTPPDMKILVPTNLISVGLDPASGHRMLRYTHITEDAGTGPFELDRAMTRRPGSRASCSRSTAARAPGSGRSTIRCRSR